jgi:hypothetical protein
MRTTTLLALLTLTACGASHAYYATPVAPAPTSPSEEAALRKAISAEWRNWSTIHTDGIEEEEKALRVFMVFREDGTGEQGLGTKRTPFTYKIEGKNIVTTDPNFATLRVESVTPEELRMFWYALSVTLVYKPGSAFTGWRK